MKSFYDEMKNFSCFRCQEVLLLSQVIYEVAFGTEQSTLPDYLPTVT